MKSNVKNIIFLHGFLENKTMWNSVIRAMPVKNNYISYDLIGHGLNKKTQENLSILNMADDLYDFLLAKEIQGDIHLVGHSMGAYVALEFTKHYPEKVKSLAIINSTCLADSSLKKKQRLLAIKAMKKNFNLFVTIGFKNLFAVHHREKLKEQVEYAKNMALETTIDGAVNASLAMRNRLDNSEVLTFDIPKIFVYGLYDDLLNTEDLNYQKSIAYRTKFYPLDSGHMSFLEQEKLLLNILTTFFDKKE